MSSCSMPSASRREGCAVAVDVAGCSMRSNDANVDVPALLPRVLFIVFFVMEIESISKGTSNVKYSLMLGGIVLKKNFQEKHYYGPHYSNIKNEENVF